MFQGDQLTSVETTTVFFGVTKLFQSTNQNLRRMMYLFIKEVAETCNPDDVIIVTSSLTKVRLAAFPPSLPPLLPSIRLSNLNLPIHNPSLPPFQDMNSREDLYRANAIRVLSKIIDSTMLGAIER